MSLAERIFPCGPPRDGHILRLDLVESWESQLLGVGRAAAFLTPRLFSQSHAVDDIGLYVIFLQRHRVELGLKLIQERTGAVRPGHVISALAAECEAACRAAGFADAWEAFASAQQEYMELMEDADPKAATFRYPVDASMRPWPRETRVDLVELERAGNAFERDVSVLVAALAEAEPLPVDKSEAVDAARDLCSLVRASRNFRTIHDETTRRFREQSDALWGPMSRHLREHDAYAAAAAVAQVTERVTERVERMLDRIVAAYDVVLDDEEPLAAVSEMPALRLSSGPRVMREALLAQERWYVDEFVRGARPLNLAVQAVYERTKPWVAGPAARQVHLDVARFRSRLLSRDVVAAS